MLRLLAVLILLAACDEADPATSERCVMARMRVIETRYHINMVKGGVPALELEIQRFINANWECFK